MTSDKIIIPDFYQPILETQITGEVQSSFSKPEDYNTETLPFVPLGGRRFEILAYLIISNSQTNRSLITTLVKSSGDQGRDILIHSNGALISIIQCKNLEHKLSKPDLLEEIVKLALHNYIHDFIPKAGIVYELWAPNGLTEPASQIIQEWPTSVPESDIKAAFIEVTNRYKGLKSLQWHDCVPYLIQIFPKLVRVVWQDGLKISMMVRSNPIVYDRFFQTLSVMRRTDVDTLLDEKFQKYSTITNPFSALTDEITRQKPPFPRLQDFIDGKINKSVVYNRIKAALDSDYRFLIWGNAGAGKSVLAFNIGIEYHKSGFTSCYLDLSAQDSAVEVERIIAFLNQRSNDKYLLILDNCHECRSFASQYPYLRRLQLSKQFHTLFISRTAPLNITDVDKTYSFPELYANDGGAYQEIVPNDSDFKAVVDLFISKKFKVIPNTAITYTTLRQRFGNDLFVFAYTICYTPGVIHLDAIDPSVQSFQNAIDCQYFNRFSKRKSALEAFVNLSVFSSLSIPATKRSFPGVTLLDNILSDEVAEGIILQNKSGILALPHSSLANIIVKRYAVLSNKKPVQIVSEAILNCRHLPASFFGLIEDQRYYKQESLLKYIYNDIRSAELLLNQQLILPSRYWDMMADNFRGKYVGLLKRNIDATVKALPYVDLTTSCNVLYRIIARDDRLIEKTSVCLFHNAEAIWSVVSRTSPHIVTKYLSLLVHLATTRIISPKPKKQMLGLHDFIIGKIVDPTSSYYHVLVNSSVSLGYTASLLGYIKDFKKESHEQLLVELLAPSNCSNLMLRGLSRQPDQFAKFLEFCTKHAGFKREQWIPELMKPKALRLLDSFLSDWQLDSILYYFRFWETCSCKDCNGYFRQLFLHVFPMAKQPYLIKRLKLSTIQQIASFLKYSIKSDTDIIGNISSELLKSDFIDAVYHSSSQMMLFQLMTALDELSLNGNIGRQFSELLSKKFFGSIQHVAGKLRTNSDIRDTVYFLQSCDTKTPTPISASLLALLRKESFFERWVNSSLSVYQKGAIPLRSKSSSGIITRITIIINFLRDADRSYAEDIVSILNRDSFAVVNLLLSDHIDMVPLLIRCLDSVNSKYSSLSDEIIALLDTNTCLNILCLNSFKKDVSYLKSFLEHFSKRHIGFYGSMLRCLETTLFEKTLDACATSTPHQLKSFLEYLDDNNTTGKLTSKAVLESLSSNRYNLFQKKLAAEVDIHRHSFEDYLKTKHREFSSSLAISAIAE